MRKRLLRGVGWLLLALASVLLLPVLALRWLPAPTSAFMLQSEVKPVRYQWVAGDEISDAVRRAVVASEDQKFYEHSGFDIEALRKAHANNQKKGRRIRGASTISQQLAKNLFLWPGGGYFRKGIEAVYTVLIEAIWPKQRILTVYLNIAEFGPGLYGVGAASQAYFGKPAAKLSNQEAARLAAVLPNPAKWKVLNPGPYVQRRTAWILRQMGAASRPAVSAEPDAEPLPPRQGVESEEDRQESPPSSDVAPEVESVPPPLEEPPASPPEPQLGPSEPEPPVVTEPAPPAEGPPQP